MAKLLQHLGFGGKKKANNSNSSSMDNQNRRINSETDECADKSGGVGRRNVNGEGVNGAVESGGGGSVDGGGGVDLRVSRGRSDSRQPSSSTSESPQLDDLGQYIFHTDSRLLIRNNMKRQNAVKTKRKYKTATDGQPIDVNEPDNVLSNQNHLPIGYNNVFPPNQRLINKLAELEDDYAEPVDFCHPSTNRRAAEPTTPSWHVRGADDVDEEEADYTEPFQVVVGVAGALSPVETSQVKDDDDDNDSEFAYDEVYEYKDDHRQPPVSTDVDFRPSEEYDAPWEWREIPRLMPQQNSHDAPCENEDIFSLEAEVEEEVEDDCPSGFKMSGGRPCRHIYETAFDSCSVKSSVKDVDDEIGNHPILTSSMLVTSGGKRETSSSSPTSTFHPSPVLAVGGTKVKSQNNPNIGPTNIVRERSKKSSEHLVRALVHVPPRSANSTPTLSTYRKDAADNSSSCASSAKSTPTHFLSKCAHQSNNLPLRQLSDLTLGEQQRGKETALRSSTASMPPTTAVGVSVDRRIDDPGLGSSSSGGVSSEESVASSSSSSSSSGNNNNSSNCSVDNCHRPFALTSFDIQRTTKPLVNRFILQQRPQQQHGDRVVVVVDTRPSDDYDPPWDSSAAIKPPRTILLLGGQLSSSSSASLTTSSMTMSSSSSTARGSGSGDSCSNSDASSLTPPLLRTSICDSDEQHRIIDNNEANLQKQPSLDRPKRPTLQLSFNKESSSRPSLRSNLSLDLNLNNSQSPPKLKRKDLILNFGCPMMSTLPEPVDASIPLERQGWYHGAISRTEAENLLRILQEGSYLVRNSESSKNDYSLSLKSARGFMHMKIVSSEGKYILGQFSKPFNSIPEMIHHYSICKLPIKGAEHMSLLHPVIDQLL